MLSLSSLSNPCFSTTLRNELFLYFPGSHRNSIIALRVEILLLDCTQTNLMLSPCQLITRPFLCPPLLLQKKGGGMSRCWWNEDRSYMYVRIYICTHTHIYMRVHTRICMYVYVHVHVHVYLLSGCPCICMYVRVCESVRVYV